MFLSYVCPIRIKHGSSEQNPVLELYLNKGHLQLTTLDAVYSDGDHYRPLVLAFKKLGNSLPRAREALVLGTGLGSAMHILNRLGFHPFMTMVDNDPLILDWLRQSLTARQQEKLTLILEDAKSFVSGGDAKYDLIVVDIFTGRTVPSFVEESAFLVQCRRRIQSGGNLVLNYIINDDLKWDAFRSEFSIAFPDHEIIELGVNRVFVARV